MILGNRRLRLLYIALAGMDMAVFLPWLTIIVTFWARNGDAHSVAFEALLTQNPLLIFIVFWGTMQFYMLITDLLSQWKISGGLYAAAVLVILVITSLLLVRLLLYPFANLNDFIWLRETISAFLDLVLGIRGEILLILTNYILWMRVARYTDRGLTFFAIGVSFRLGMLVVILGCALLAYWSGQNQAALLYLLLFFAFGLASVALARIDHKALGASNSSGALLPWDRFAQLWVIIIALLSSAYAVANFYTPNGLKSFLGLFAPVGYFLQWIFSGLVFGIFFLLTPFFEWLAARIQEMIAQSPPQQMGEFAPPPEPLPLNEVVQEFAMLRYCIAATIIFVAAILILMFLVRMTRKERTTENEESATEAGLRPTGIRLGFDRLKDWFALLGRYGLGSQLLAAISVENIYANLSRIARRQGFPRRPSEGPDRYLPTLLQAFPGHDADLNQITAAYIRARYAERPITPEELEELRAAYERVTTPPEKSSSQQSTQSPTG